MQIGDHDTTTSGPYIIAEVANSHWGQLHLAQHYIEAAAAAGAHAVKFQAHDPSEGVGEKFRTPIAGYQSRADYWAAMQLPWRQVARYCKVAQVDFLCSPFYLAAVEELAPLVPAWKIASGEATHWPLVQKCIDTGKPLLVSRGLVTTEEWANMQPLYQVAANVGGVLWLNCHSEYPGRGYVAESMRGCGLSDHSGNVANALLAIARGAEVIELHLKLHPADPAIDAPASITPAELALVCRTARTLHEREPIPPAPGMRRTFMRMICTRGPIRKGEKLTSDRLQCLKPRTASGICASRWPLLVGCTAAHDLPDCHAIEPEDVAEIQTTEAMDAAPTA